MSRLKAVHDGTAWPVFAVRGKATGPVQCLGVGILAWTNFLSGGDSLEDSLTQHDNCSI